ncbi:hypothetical protein UFOVP273_131 [uncultured Caudovirales phage]|uniref:Uncharacterized protein n=1 Tax=uncultured Caudovirales phage TaxID=2100421 RepID=A0A6J5LLW0_9CAUD|nr:hypothetical protein UFOVP273_131 [uncultured Caudovirales phage]
MTKDLPVAHPAEVIEISPEALEIANAYLQNPRVDEVAKSLGVSTDFAVQILGRREVRAYIDRVFIDLGFNNRFKMRQLMDAIIEKKLQEMDEAGIGSNKDILEILALSHKMYMDQVNAELALEKLRKANQPKTQTNIQINETKEAGQSSNYATLLQRILTNGNIIDDASSNN